MVSLKNTLIIGAIVVAIVITLIPIIVFNYNPDKPNTYRACAEGQAYIQENLPYKIEHGSCKGTYLNGKYKGKYYIEGYFYVNYYKINYHGIISNENNNWYIENIKIEEL
jgi:hypothetical protein